MEEDAGVRFVTASILQHGGFEVIERTTPSEVMDGGLPQFDVLLTDGALNEQVTGMELAKILREDNPRLPVICMTGYAPELLKIDPRSGIAVMAKPYQPNDLLMAIRSALA